MKLNCDSVSGLRLDVDEPIESGHSLNGVLTGADLRLNEAMVRSVRDAVGIDVDLCIDGHDAFDVPRPFVLLRLSRIMI